MRYLVTGGLGFVGAPLARALARAGHRVRVLDDGSRGKAERLAEAREAVELIEGDVRDAEAVSRAMRGIDAVCHLAAVNGTRHFYERPADVLEVGVKGMVNVLDACRREGVGELLLASSSEVYQTPPMVPTDETVPLSIPDPHNPRYSYAGSKIISELMAIHGGGAWLRRVLVVRPHNVYGPDMGWDHVIPELTSKLVRLQQASGDGELSLPIQGTGAATRAFLYIEDCTSAFMTILERGAHRNIYHIGSSESVSIGELAHRIAACLGVTVRLVPGPAASGGTPRRCPDITKLKHLGFQPRVRFDEGLRTTVAWYATQLRGAAHAHAVAPTPAT